MPWDFAFYRRFDQREEVRSCEEVNRGRNSFMSCYSNQQEVELLQINPNSSEYYPVAISDDYPDSVKNGEIKVRQEVSPTKFITSKLVLSDNSSHEADVVIFATGYRHELPYFDKSIKQTFQFDGCDMLQPTILYEGTIHPELPGLGLVGAYKGPFFGAMELQARMAARWTLGEDIGVTEEGVQAGLEQEMEIRNCTPRPQFPRADYVQFMDRMAAHIGCLPDTDIDYDLHQKFFAQPVIPTHYRLRGPNADFEAALEQIRQVDSFVYGDCSLEKFEEAKVNYALRQTHQGRARGNELLEQLVGTWKVERKIDEFPDVTGIATFTSERGGLKYHEDVSYTRNNEQVQAFQDYEYRLAEDGIALYFLHGERAGNLFMNLRFDQVDDEDPSQAEAVHLCGDDKYEGLFTFTDKDRFSIWYKVTGPEKDYAIFTQYTRHQ